MSANYKHKLLKSEMSWLKNAVLMVGLRWNDSSPRLLEPR